MRLGLVRHGETDGQRAGRYQGASDPPLCPLGPEPARARGPRLRDGLGRVWFGPLGRVRGALAEIISRPESALVVCHGGVIRAMLCILLALPRARAFCFDIHPAAMTVLEVDGGRGLLLGLNL